MLVTVLLSLIGGLGIFIFVLRRINYLKYKIKSKSGICQRTRVVSKGRQIDLLIRGENVENPIILFLHESPAHSNSYLSYSFLHSFQENYLFVYWDQTGTGRNYRKNQGPIEYQRVYEDLEILVDYLRKRFHKRKIVIMGHSFGTYLGLNYIKNNPDKVEAFLSIGQVVKTREGLTKSAERVFNMYKKQDRTEAHELFHMCGMIQNKKKLDYAVYKSYNIMKNKISKKLSKGRKKVFWKVLYYTIASPDITWKDIKWASLCCFHRKKFISVFGGYIQRLADADIVKEFGNEFQVPFYMIYGDKDYLAPPEMITEFYNQLSVPRKNLIGILDAGHRPHLDNQKTVEATVSSLLNEVYGKK